MVRQYLQKYREIVARLIAWLIFRGPVVVTAGRTRLVLDPKSGRLLPAMGGGDDDDGDDDAGDAADDDGDEDAKGKGNGDDDSGDDEDDDDGDDAKSKGDDDIDWKRMARRHERRAKAAQKRADELAADQKKRADETKSEHEKAIEKAREEARTEALTEAEKDRRADRLELAVTRLAAKGIKIGDGDKAKTVKFADPEDALVHLERAIAKGDIEDDEIYDDAGKVQTDALTTALQELLVSKPHLRATDNAGGRGGGTGDIDGGKGDRGGAKDLDEMSIDDHLKQVQKG